MARIVKFEATGRIEIEPQDKPVFVCACGISRKSPCCDGSHKSCKGEAVRIDSFAGDLRNRSEGRFDASRDRARPAG